MTHIKQWAGMFIVALALAVLINKFAGPGTETAEADSPKTLWLGAASFVPTRHLNLWHSGGPGIIGEGYFIAPITLPPGKKITGMTVDFVDLASDPLTLCVWLYIDAPGPGVNTIASGCSTNPNTSSSMAFPVSPSYKLSPSDIPFVEVRLQGYSEEMRLHRVGIQYK
jgi:hypothetical protein